MLKSVEGIFRNGKIELLEPAPAASDARVLVTFFTQAGLVDLQARGIDDSQAASLRDRLNAIAEDWNRPEMSVYDEP